MTRLPFGRERPPSTSWALLSSSPVGRGKKAVGRATKKCRNAEHRRPFNWEKAWSRTDSLSFSATDPVGSYGVQEGLAMGRRGAKKNVLKNPKPYLRTPLPKRETKDHGWTECLVIWLGPDKGIGR